MMFNLLKKSQSGNLFILVILLNLVLLTGAAILVQSFTDFAQIIPKEKARIEMLTVMQSFALELKHAFDTAQQFRQSSQLAGTTTLCPPGTTSQTFPPSLELCLPTGGISITIDKYTYQLELSNLYTVSGIYRNQYDLYVKSSLPDDDNGLSPENLLSSTANAGPVNLPPPPTGVSNLLDVPDCQANPNAVPCLQCGPGQICIRLMVCPKNSICDPTKIQNYYSQTILLQAPCTCTDWVVGLCGGACDVGRRPGEFGHKNYTRICNPLNCNSQSICLADATCP